MKVTSEQFKELCCIANRMCRNAKVSFVGHTWISKNGKNYKRKNECKR